MRVSFSDIVPSRIRIARGSTTSIDSGRIGQMTVGTTSSRGVVLGAIDDGTNEFGI